MKKKTLAQLFCAFLKIGAFTFGGGYAMLPLIRRETMETRGWIDEDTMADILAIAESTPGPIAVNAATFIGYRMAGIPGALAATTGVILPSFALIAILSFVLERVQDLRAVRYAFFGIRAAVPALVVRALWQTYNGSPKGIFGCVIAALACAAVVFLHVHVVLVMLSAAAVGLIASLAAKRRAAP